MTAAPLKLRESSTGIGHQLQSEVRHMRSARNYISEAYGDLINAGNTTEVLDLRTSLHKIIIRLDELACAAEEQYNQNV
jgi:hypothetical protein